MSSRLRCFNVAEAAEGDREGDIQRHKKESNNNAASYQNRECCTTRIKNAKTGIAQIL